MKHHTHLGDCPAQQTAAPKDNGNSRREQRLRPSQQLFGCTNGWEGNFYLSRPVVVAPALAPALALLPTLPPTLPPALRPALPQALPLAIPLALPPALPPTSPLA